MIPHALAAAPLEGQGTTWANAVKILLSRQLLLEVEVFKVVLAATPSAAVSNLQSRRGRAGRAQKAVVRALGWRRTL